MSGSEQLLEKAESRKSGSGGIRGSRAPIDLAKPELRRPLGARGAAVRKSLPARLLDLFLVEYSSQLRGEARCISGARSMPSTEEVSPAAPTCLFPKPRIIERW